jgi:thioester reductase-like protein
MDDKWVREGATTLHGVAMHDFPNYFFFSLAQTGLAPNVTCMLDVVAPYVAATLAEVERRCGDRSDRLTVEVTKAAEDEWTAEVVKRATWYAGIPGCTPGYFNNQGKVDDLEEQLKTARAAPWGEGFINFVEELTSRRSSGNLKGYQVEADGEAV